MLSQLGGAWVQVLGGSAVGGGRQDSLDPLMLESAGSNRPARAGNHFAAHTL